MRKLVLFAVLALIVVAILYHARLFIRDPLGRVERNGIPDPDARVYVNYWNDVLVQQQGGRHMFVVQHSNKLPGEPASLTCIQGLLCLTPSDQAVPGTADASNQAQMSDREVSFTDPLGDHIDVQIR